MIDRLASEIGLDEEKAVMLEHMILSHHYEPEFGSPKRPMFPEAELLHYLDIFDARLFDMEEATASVPPGEFSEKVWTLENRKDVYKRQHFVFLSVFQPLFMRMLLHIYKIKCIIIQNGKQRAARSV